jgi:hypothetical protein
MEFLASRSAVALVAILAAFLLGATAIDKNDEQSCEDRWVAYVKAFPGTGLGGVDEEAPSRRCGGFLPW